MYDGLIKSLRDMSKMGMKYGMAVVKMREAAEAIEELNGFVQEAERDRDEYIERLDKANNVIEELQKRVPKRPHGRLIDSDALVEDLKYDVELDVVALDSMEIVGDERRKIQEDKDFKQNCIFWIENAPTVIQAEERNRSAE